MKLQAVTVLALTASLAACGSKTETNEASATDTTPSAVAESKTMASDMGNMAVPPTSKMAKGTGKVTALDKSAGTITLEHGPIAEANWPAMTMAFKAAPALIDSVKVGDEVSFDLKLTESSGEITAIKAR